MAQRMAQQADIKVGDEVDGTVLRESDMGLWLDIGTGKEALWPKRLLPKQEYRPEIGQSVDGLTVNEIRAADLIPRVMSKTLLSDFRQGDWVSGEVVQIRHDGVFLGIGGEQGYDGLLRENRRAMLPMADVMDACEDMKMGDRVRARVVNVDGGRILLSLGTPKKPEKKIRVPAIFELDEIHAGDVASGIVIRMVDTMGVFVDIGVRRGTVRSKGLLRNNQLRNSITEYTVGQELTGLRVVGVNEEKNLVGLTQLAESELDSSATRPEPTTFEELRPAQRLVGVIKRADEHGFSVDIGLPRHYALLPAKLLGSKGKDDFQVGESYEFIVSKVNVEDYQVSLRVDPPPEEDFKEGDVVSGTVVAVSEVGLDVEVGVIRCSIRKIDITALATDFQISDIFAEGMQIKAVVLAMKDHRSGMPRLSTRALELEPGMMLTDAQKVFDTAELGTFVRKAQGALKKRKQKARRN